MPNYCEYTMKLIGARDNCDQFMKKLEDHNEPNHFHRIFSNDIYDEGELDDGRIVRYIAGDCAWSIESCCRSGYTNVDLFAINTKDLDLELEVFSREPGVGFEEHYIYNKGDCLVDECKDTKSFWWDRDEYPTYEDFIKEYPNAPEEEAFDDCDVVYIGGFGDDYEDWTI